VPGPTTQKQDVGLLLFSGWPLASSGQSTRIGFDGVAIGIALVAVPLPLFAVLAPPLFPVLAPPLLLPLFPVLALLAVLPKPELVLNGLAAEFVLFRLRRSSSCRYPA
jgi:hypothetical protein